MKVFEFRTISGLGRRLAAAGGCLERYVEGAVWCQPGNESNKLAMKCRSRPARLSQRPRCRPNEVTVWTEARDGFSDQKPPTHLTPEHAFQL